MSASNNLLWASLSNIVAENGYTTTGPADTGTALDIRDWDGVIAFTLNAINTAGTGPTLAASVIHCATSGGTYTSVTGGTFTTITGATSAITNAAQMIVLDVSSLKRYIKFSTTLAATSGTATYDIVGNAIGTKKTVGAIPGV